MVSYIWFFLIVVGIVYSFLTGNISVINESILTNGADALALMLSIFPVIVLWSGIMKIAEEAGMLRKFAKILEPILSKLFPSVPKGNLALGFIASNIAANMMGLGSAATPFGLKAMTELQKINDKKDTASVPMITFLVLNTAGVTIVPTTVLAPRTAHGSANPSEIILPGAIATFCSCIGAVTIDYFIRKRGKN